MAAIIAGAKIIKNNRNPLQATNARARNSSHRPPVPMQPSNGYGLTKFCVLFTNGVMEIEVVGSENMTSQWIVWLGICCLAAIIPYKSYQMDLLVTTNEISRIPSLPSYFLALRPHPQQALEV